MGRGSSPTLVKFNWWWEKSDHDHCLATLGLFMNKCTRIKHTNNRSKINSQNFWCRFHTAVYKGARGWGFEKSDPLSLVRYLPLDAPFNLEYHLYGKDLLLGGPHFRKIGGNFVHFFWNSLNTKISTFCIKRKILYL